jgi:hypothetical protein
MLIIMFQLLREQRGRRFLNRLLTLSLFFTIAIPYASVVSFTGFSADDGLSPIETNVLALVNGSEAYSYDIHLESIGLSHYAFRAAGSLGANETADWIANQFKTFGLEAEKEEFQFTTWDLLSQPTSIIDDDGNLGTTGDQVKIESFQSAHYSLPTPDGGVFADLVVLPLPATADRSKIGLNPIDINAWSALDIAGKVVLIGQEVRWDSAWEETYVNKLKAETPAAVIYTWWYDWLAFVPDSFSSAGGRPLSPLGAYYWDLKIPVGFVNYKDGLWIRNRERNMNVSANIVIESVVDVGPHYNVVGKLDGYVEPDRSVIVSGHYDSVMCGGFCDNGAGTSGVIELARVFAEAVKKGWYYPKFTIVFVAFAGEEIGLVGSVNYVRMHKAEMSDIVALANLDCIGSDFLHVTETDPIGGLDLDEVIWGAAHDLGIAVKWEEPGGSDQETFLNPASLDYSYHSRWGIEAGIADAKPVRASAMLISFPLRYSDVWGMGTSGWIHTSYDNSTSTATLSWVETDDLEEQIKVAALTVVRVSPSVLPTDLNMDGTVNILDITVVARAYGAKLGDEKWNPAADLDRNGIINILDIAKVARDYGKTL